MKTILSLVIFISSLSAFSNDQILLSIGNHEAYIPSSYTKESSEQICLIKELEKTLDSIKIYGEKENLFETFRKNNIEIHIHVKSGLKKVESHLTEKLIVNLPDLGKSWCRETKVNNLSKQITLSLQGLLSEAINTQVLLQLEEIADHLEQNKPHCESLEEMRKTYKGFLYNEVTDEMFYPNGKLILVPSLRDQLRKYFYQNREMGDESHLTKNGKFMPLTILGGRFNGCTEVQKRNESGRIISTILEKECLSREVPIKVDYEIATCLDETYYVKKGEYVIPLGDSCQVIQSHQYIAPFRGEMIILNKGQDIIDTENGEEIVTLNENQKVDWINGKKTIIGKNQKTAFYKGKTIVLEKNQDVIDGTNGEEIVPLGDDEKIVFLNMKRTVVKNDQQVSMFEGKPIIIHKNEVVIDTDEGEDIVTIEENQRLGFVNNKRVILPK